MAGESKPTDNPLGGKDQTGNEGLGDEEFNTEGTNGS